MLYTLQILFIMEDRTLQPKPKFHSKRSESKRLTISHRKRIQPVPGVNKVQSWLLNSFQREETITHSLFDAQTNRLTDLNPLRSLPDGFGVLSGNEDDSSVDTTSYIKLNRTVTRMQKRDGTIRKFSKPDSLAKCQSPEPPFVKSNKLNIQETQIHPESGVTIAVKRKRLVKYSSSMNLRLKRFNRGDALSSSSSSELLDDGVAAPRSMKRCSMVNKNRVRHDSI